MAARLVVACARRRHVVLRSPALGRPAEHAASGRARPAALSPPPPPPCRPGPRSASSGTDDRHDRTRRDPGLLDGPGPSFADHVAAHGPLPVVDVHALVEEAGLTGRGGAGFPTAAKLRSVAAAAAATRKAPVVVANGSEGEPAAAKDATLLVLAPHLVFDGLALVAASLGASPAFLAADPALLPGLAAHLADRRDPVGVRLHPVAEAFLSGEESALCAALEGKPPLPRTKFPRCASAAWTAAPRSCSTSRPSRGWHSSPGGASSPPPSMLVTRRMEIAGTPWVDVVDVPLGTRLGDVLRLDDVQAVLIGGYAGTWVEARRAAELRLDRGSLAPAGAALGAGVLAALPADRCGLRETARVVGYLAEQSAGQCGPCLNGLPRIAAALDLLARPAPPPSGLLAGRQALVRAAPGRGACSHPDASVRLVASALHVFRDELAGTGPDVPRPERRPFLPFRGARGDPARGRPHRLHRPRPVRRAAAGGHRPRRVGLPAARRAASCRRTWCGRRGRWPPPARRGPCGCGTTSGALTAAEQPPHHATGAADRLRGELQDRAARDAGDRLHDRCQLQQAADVVHLEPPTGDRRYRVDAPRRRLEQQLGGRLDGRARSAGRRPPGGRSSRGRPRRTPSRRPGSRA